MGGPSDNKGETDGREAWRTGEKTGGRHVGRVLAHGESTGLGQRLGRRRGSSRGRRDCHAGTDQWWLTDRLMGMRSNTCGWLAGMQGGRLRHVNRVKKRHGFARM